MGMKTGEYDGLVHKNSSLDYLVHNRSSMYIDVYIYSGYGLSI